MPAAYPKPGFLFSCSFVFFFTMDETYMNNHPNKIHMLKMACLNPYLYIKFILWLSLFFVGSFHTFRQVIDVVILAGGSNTRLECFLLLALCDVIKARFFRPLSWGSILTFLATENKVFFHRLLKMFHRKPRKKGGRA